jgi:hypothetical protein
MGHIDLVENKSNGNNILVGNSATYTNNHIDSFKIITKCNLHSDSNIVCPLNYGSQQYQSLLLDIGKKYFGDRFKPLLTFLSFKQYIELLGTCSHAIMNHIRQQAGGNILIMLFLGAKVFLDKRSPFYNHYKKMGITIFSIEDLQNDSNSLISPMENDIKKKNRDLLMKSINQNVAINQTRNLIETCIKENKP